LAKLTAPVMLSGYDLDMYGGDREHPPPHLHVLCRDKWEIKVFFRASVLQQEIVFEVKWPVSKRESDCPLKKKERKELLEQITMYIDGLNTQWDTLNSPAARQETANEDA
jgi:hypothetical protein